MEPPSSGPVILFDGVCNLCNAAVQWVIERDRRARFRFGALQSEAGRAALRASVAAADLPDSIVLLDADGAHVRSDAAIRIARGLGFPWSLAAAAAVVPRPLRDAVYSWVARNRYRWFGRRESCMVPTPELASRFVDAGELPAHGPPAAAAVAHAPGSVRGGFALRALLAYFVLYILCFPLGTIPGTQGLAERYERLLHAVVSRVAFAVFGKKLTVFTNGSGDTTYDYVAALTFAVVALAAAGAWTLLRRGRPVSGRAFFLTRTYVRYYLGAVMLSYGWSKVIPLQFPSIGPDSLVMGYGESSPMGLLWRFMGASTAYQIFTGLAELLGGALLLARRTALAGALVSSGVLANIFMLNLCFDVPVKLFSLHLLFMAVFLIAPDVMRLAGVFLLNVPVQPAPHLFRIRRAWLRRTLAAANAAFVALVAVYPAYEGYEDLQKERQEAPALLAGVYRVESFSSDGVAGRELSDDSRWVRVGINPKGLIAFQRADGTAVRFRVKIDDVKGTLTLTRSDDTTPATFRFTKPEPGVVRVDGTLAGKAIVAALRRQPDDAFLLTGRGFRWINEYPFNR